MQHVLSPWPKRGKRFDEMLQIIRGLSTGEYFSFRGEFYELADMKLCPAPTKPLPLLIGGHSDAALKRGRQVWRWVVAWWWRS